MTVKIDVKLRRLKTRPKSDESFYYVTLARAPEDLFRHSRRERARLTAI